MRLGGRKSRSFACVNVKCVIVCKCYGTAESAVPIFLFIPL